MQPRILSFVAVSGLSAFLDTMWLRWFKIYLSIYIQGWCLLTRVRGRISPTIDWFFKKIVEDNFQSSLCNDRWTSEIAAHVSFIGRCDLVTITKSTIYSINVDIDGTSTNRDISELPWILVKIHARMNKIAERKIWKSWKNLHQWQQ